MEKNTKKYKIFRNNEENSLRTAGKPYLQGTDTKSTMS